MLQQGCRYSRTRMSRAEAKREFSFYKLGIGHLIQIVESRFWGLMVWRCLLIMFRICRLSEKKLGVFCVIGGPGFPFGAFRVLFTLYKFSFLLARVNYFQRPSPVPFIRSSLKSPGIFQVAPAIAILDQTNDRFLRKGNPRPRRKYICQMGT